MLWSKWVEATTTHPVKIRMPSTTGIAGGVATTGEPEQTGSYNHRDFKPEVAPRLAIALAAHFACPSSMAKKHLRGG
jgi:hypothetical protein